MTSVLKLEIASICIIHIIAIVLSVICLTIFYFKTRRNDHAANAFIAMQVCIIIWMVFKIFKTVSPEIHLRWVSILGYYAATCVFEIAFVEFGYAYYKGCSIPFKIRKIIYFFPVIQFLLILTNPYHYLFYSYYDFWRDSFGPLFYVHMLMVYSFIGVGFYYCSKRFKLEFAGKNRVVTYIVSFAIITPLVLNFLFITKVIHQFTIFAKIPVVFDITPIVFTWSTLMFMYATFNYDFITPTPLMRHEITHHLNLAIGIFNEKLSLVYANTAFENMTMSNEKFTDVVNGIKPRLKGVGEFGYEDKMGDESFFIYLKKIKGLFRKKYLVSMKNISAYKNIHADIMEKKESLIKKNDDLENTINDLKNLSKDSARKYVARELHDVIGHSMVTCVKLLEVSKIYNISKPEKGRKALYNSLKAVESGLYGIQAVPVKEGDLSERTGEDLKNNIEEMIETIRNTGLDVSLNFQGVIYLLDKSIFHTLDRVCTELITNCIKHAKASRLFLSLKIKEKDVSLLAIDNGVGLDEEQTKGSGLSGIEDRISSLGGNVVFSPMDDEGFMVRILIPRKK